MDALPGPSAAVRDFLGNIFFKPSTWKVVQLAPDIAATSAGSAGVDDMNSRCLVPGVKLKAVANIANWRVAALSDFSSSGGTGLSIVSCPSLAADNCSSSATV
jgi:hypothetical protein